MALRSSLKGSRHRSWPLASVHCAFFTSVRRGIRDTVQLCEHRLCASVLLPEHCKGLQGTSKMAEHVHTSDTCYSSGENAQSTTSIARLMAANRAWAEQVRRDDPLFFRKLEGQQSPEFLWIGCSDSRVPANQILGLAPGEIFVQRNVGNQVLHTDMNVMACVEYAVTALKVNTIIVCGHYNCGAVKAALTLPTATPGLVNCWIADIRECRNQSEAELQGLSADEQLTRLCELNVLRQVFSVATSPVVAAAWEKGQPLAIYGMIYSLSDGIIKQLAGPISGEQSYGHNFQEFMSHGIQFERCPTTKTLKLTASDGGSGDQYLAGVRRRGTTEEIEAGLNSVQLMDRISRHQHWLSPRSSMKGNSSPRGSALPAPANA